MVPRPTAAGLNVTAFCLASALFAAACSGSSDVQPLARPGGGAGGSLGGATSVDGGASGEDGGRAGSRATGGAGGKGREKACELEPDVPVCGAATCFAGLVCVGDPDVCLNAHCVCNGIVWSCHGFCGGGTCKPGKTEDFPTSIRVGFESGVLPVRDFCVSYWIAEVGLPLWDPTPVLKLGGVDGSALEGLANLSRYVPMPRPVRAIGYTVDGTCTPDKIFGVLVLDDVVFPYQTVIARPSDASADGLFMSTNGGYVELTVRATHGPDDAAPPPGRYKLVDATHERRGLDFVMDGDPQVAAYFSADIAYAPAAKSPVLVLGDPSAAFGNRLHFDFSSFGGVQLDRTTFVIHGADRKLFALLCDDTHPERDFFGGPLKDPNTSGCFTVEVTDDDF